MKKIGIIGGAGFIGSYITKIFLEEDFTVKTSVTDLSNKQKYLHLKNLPKASNLEITEMNVLETGSIKKFSTGCNILVHGGAPFRLEVKNPQKELFLPIVNGTENFLNVVKNIPTVEKVVILSCVNAYNTSFPLPADDKSPDYLYTEDDVPYMHENNHTYSQARFYADQTVREFTEANPELSFEIVSLFPTFVIGKPLSDRDDSISVRMQNMLRDNPASDILPGMLQEKKAELAMVDVNDVAKAVFKAAAKSGLHGKNYFLSSESWKVSDLSRMLNNRSPAGKPSIAYSNKLASSVLGVNFKPINESLNNSEMVQPDIN